MAFTSMDDIVIVKVIDSRKNLADGLRGVLLRKLAVLADPIKQFSTSSKLSDDVVFILCNFSVYR